MNIDDIKAQVEKALAHEARTGELATHIRTTLGDKGDDARVQSLVGTLREFVSSMPAIIESTLAAADAAGAKEFVEPVFGRALSYLSEEGDFIPDEIGLAGLLDDAYIVRELMQELSHRHRMVTGHPLIPNDMGAVNQRVRRMIGEPTATRMDAAIIAFARRQDVRETIDSAMTRIGGQRLTMRLPISTAFGDSGSPDVPDLKLGTLGQKPADG